MALAKLDDNGPAVVVPPTKGNSSPPPNGGNSPKNQPSKSNTGKKPDGGKTKNTKQPDAKKPTATQPVTAPKGETLEQAITRMRNQDVPEWQIKAQIKKWHPTWTDAQIARTMKAAPGPGGYIAKTNAAKGKASGHSEGIKEPGRHAEREVAETTITVRTPASKHLVDAIGRVRPLEPADRTIDDVRYIHERPLSTSHGKIASLPRTLVCGPTYCAEVILGHVQVSSPHTSIRSMEVRGKNIRIATGRGATVFDSSLWTTVEAGLSEQTGVLQAQGQHSHLRGGLHIPIGSRATVRSRSGAEREVQPVSAVADVAVVYPPRMGQPTYNLSARTTLHLPDGTVLHQNADITIRIVRRPRDVPEVPSGALHQVGIAARDQSRPTYGLSIVASSVVARTQLLAFDEETPAGSDRGHDPEEPQFPPGRH